MICLIACRGVRLSGRGRRREPALTFGERTRLRVLRFAPRELWRPLVTLISISAFLWNSTGTVEAAGPAYSPVFYYYSGDYLGSSNVLTDRSGNLVQHYEYSTFGQTSYQNNTSAFPVSNRYTGQISDDETGLYYYGARYYDAQLGRFIQPDTEVQAPDNPQTLNRYSYCGNNPLNCIDPSGNFFWFFIAAVLIGAAFGAMSTPKDGNVGLGALSGAIAGLCVAFGLGIIGPGLKALGCIAQPLGGAIGGAAGGASAAAIQGGNLGIGALIGGTSGAIFGALDGGPNNGYGYSANDGYDSTRITAETYYHAPTPPQTDDLPVGVASAAGGATTAAGTAIANHSIGEPSVLVSMIPVIGNGLEVAHFLSTGQWGWATLYAAGAVLDLTGVGEAGDLALKVGLRVAEKITAEAAAETSARVLANRAAGSAFRDEIAEQLSKGGLDVEKEVYYKTPFGKRFIDIQVSKDGQVLGGIETKVGASRYTRLQQAKDTWLWYTKGYKVNVVRKP